MADIKIVSDSGKFKAGADSDLEVYSDGSHSYVKNTVNDQTIVLSTKTGGTNTSGITLDGSNNVTLLGNIIMGDDTSIGIADDAERIEFDGAGDISVLGANLLVGHTAKVDSTEGFSGNLQVFGGAVPSMDIFCHSTTDAHSGALTFSKSSNATTGTGGTVVDNERLGKIMFGGYDGSNYQTNSVQIHAEVDDSGITTNQVGGALVFSTALGASNDDIAEKMRIDASGSVGIGTASPAGLLQVEATSGHEVSTGMAYIHKNYATNHPTLVVKQSGTGGNNETTQGMLLDVAGTALGKSFEIQNSGTARVTVLNNGNVGIGTTVPQTNLVISKGSGAGVMPSTVSVANSYLQIANKEWSGGTGYALISFGYTGGTAAQAPAVIGYQETSQASYTKGNLIFGVRDTTGDGDVATERMRITSAGNVGIGIAPTAKLSIKNTTDAATALFVQSSTANLASGDKLLHLDFENNTPNPDDDGYFIVAEDKHETKFVLRSDAFMGIGTTSTPNGTSVYGSAFVPISYDRSRLAIACSNSGDLEVVQFFNPNGQVGSISTNGSATAFTTSSDYRLKENEVLISDGLTRLNQLKPYRFNFKSDADKTVDGFFAHEVSDIVPEAIHGEKDAVDDEGNAEMQGIDHSKLVPLLVSAIQELSTANDALKSRIEALENA